MDTPRIGRPGPFSAAADTSSIERARALVGVEAIGLSDDQIEAMIRHADAMARVIVEAYLASIPGTKAA